MNKPTYRYFQTDNGNWKIERRFRPVPFLPIYMWDYFMSDIDTEVDALEYINRAIKIDNKRAAYKKSVKVVTEESVNKLLTGIK